MAEPEDKRSMNDTAATDALGAYHRRLCARMDRPTAITATAHKLARLVYFMLTRGQAYVEAGQQDYEER